VLVEAVRALPLDIGLEELASSNRGAASRDIKDTECPKMLGTCLFAVGVPGVPGVPGLAAVDGRLDSISSTACAGPFVLESERMTRQKLGYLSEPCLSFHQ